MTRLIWGLNQRSKKKTLRTGLGAKHIFFELKTGIGGKSAAIFVDKTQAEKKQ